jgi:hypothetical protein
VAVRPLSFQLIRRGEGDSRLERDILEGLLQQQLTKDLVAVLGHLNIQHLHIQVTHFW